MSAQESKKIAPMPNANGGSSREQLGVVVKQFPKNTSPSQNYVKVNTNDAFKST